jgi:hypothetical protein
MSQRPTVPPMANTLLGDCSNGTLVCSEAAAAYVGVNSQTAAGFVKWIINASLSEDVPTAKSALSIGAMCAIVAISGSAAVVNNLLIAIKAAPMDITSKKLVLGKLKQGADSSMGYHSTLLHLSGDMICYLCEAGTSNAVSKKWSTLNIVNVDDMDAAKIESGGIRIKIAAEQSARHKLEFLKEVKRFEGDAATKKFTEKVEGYLGTASEVQFDATQKGKLE